MSLHPIFSMEHPSYDEDLIANFEQLNLTNSPGQVYRSDVPGRIPITVADVSKWMRTHLCFLEFYLVPIGADGAELKDATLTNSAQGASRAFRELNIYIGDGEVEKINPYDDLVAHELSNIPTQRSNILKVMEGYGDTKFFSQGGRKVIMPIWSSLFLRPQALALPLIQAGGLQCQFTLAPTDNLFTAGPINRFEIQRAALRWQSITPNPSKTISIKAATLSGRPAYLPTQRIHIFQSQGNGGFNQSIVCPIGPKQSIVSLDVYFYDEAQYADRTKDKFYRFTNAGLTAWRLESGTNIRVPDEGWITHGDRDPTSLAIMLMSQSNNVNAMWNGVEFPAAWDQNQFRISYNFQAMTEKYATGLDTLGAANPYLTVYSQHGVAVPSTTRIVAVVVCDQMLTFVKGDVLISETNLG